MVLTKPLGAVMATRPASMPLPLIEASGLPFNDPHIEQRAECCSAAGQHGVDGNGANAQVAGGGSAQRAAGVESEPAEGQDEAADQHRRDVVADDGVGRAVAIEFADARADDHSHSQSRQSAHSMHHARSGKVAIALAQAER